MTTGSMFIFPFCSATRTSMVSPLGGSIESGACIAVQVMVLFKIEIARSNHRHCKVKDSAYQLVVSLKLGCRWTKEGLQGRKTGVSSLHCCGPSCFYQICEIMPVCSLLVLVLVCMCLCIQKKERALKNKGKRARCSATKEATLDTFGRSKRSSNE